MSTTAKSEFTRLDGLRAAYLTRAEKHAGFTLPRICPPSNYDSTRDSLTHDFQSVGAQAVNHLVNRLMLTMFAPSRPFMRLSLDRKVLRQLASQNVPSEAIEAALAEGEQQAVAELDNRPVRPKLYELLATLTIVGDGLLYLPKAPDDEPAVFGIRDYVLQRTPAGRISTLIVREKVLATDLTDEARAAYLASGKAVLKDTDTVHVFHWVRRTGRDRLEETTWVEDAALPDNFKETYSDADSPWVSVAWHLKRGQHYGTSHVEDYSGDFAALSALSEAQVKGAILASEFRWLVNPGGMTKPEDLENSENGAALPGVEGDVTLVANSKPGDLQVVRTIGEDYIRRIGHGFLLNSAMTRDAERVTAEEIRAQAMELETGLGGVYTRLALGLQAPIGRWLLKSVDVDLNGTKFTMRIITGLDALSRNGDLAALRAALADIAQLNNIGPIAGELNLQAIIATIFIGHGVKADQYLKTADQKAADREQMLADQAAAAGATAAASNLENPQQ